MKIPFTFEGKHYVVDDIAVKKDFIKLPDGRILCVYGWNIGNPPTPKNLFESDEDTLNAPEAIQIHE